MIRQREQLRRHQDEKTRNHSIQTRQNREQGKRICNTVSKRYTPCYICQEPHITTNMVILDCFGNHCFGKKCIEEYETHKMREVNNYIRDNCLTHVDIETNPDLFMKCPLCMTHYTAKLSIEFDSDKMNIARTYSHSIKKNIQQQQRRKPVACRRY
jgi:hypothetical protein